MKDISQEIKALQAKVKKSYSLIVHISLFHFIDFFPNHAILMLFFT
jgi:hypothetical protein